MSKHHLSRATELFYGGAYYPPAHAANERAGAPFNLLTRHVFGAVAAADADLLVDAATSTELPNAGTKTYTTADDGSSPFDNSATPAPSTIVDSEGNTVSVWALDVPRNLVCAVSHASSIVAMTIRAYGYDKWKRKLIEDFSITATGTSKSATGLKAFAYLEKFEITSAGDATANTLDIGTGTKLGLPYRLVNSYDLVRFTCDGVDEAPTIVKAVDTDPATATTGDVRGTLAPSTAPDGSKVFACWFLAADGDPTDKEDLFGVDQYDG